MNLAQMMAAAQAMQQGQEQRSQASSDFTESERAVKKEKKFQIEKLQKEMEAALKSASKKKGRLGGLSKLGKILKFVPGVGTLASAALGGIGSFSQAKAQKKALEGLLSDPRFSKYSSTFLSDPTKSFQKDASKLAGEIDPLKTGITSLGSSLVAGKLMGNLGDKIGGMFDKAGDAAIEGATEVTGDLIPTSNSFLNLEDLSKTATDKFSFKDIFEKAKGSETPLKDIFKDFNLKDALSGMDEKELTANIASIQQLYDFFSEDGAELDFDARSYFQ